MRVREGRYRAVRTRERQQGHDQLGDLNPFQPLQQQVQELSRRMQGVFQEGINTDFLFERNYLMIFLAALVIVGFYLFFVVNFKAMYSQMPAKRASDGNHTVEKGPLKGNREGMVNRSDKLEKSERVVFNTSRQEILNGLRAERNETQINTIIQKQSEMNQVQP